MAEIIRTPDAAFDGLPDFPFAPHHVEWDGLRTHYLDEGPRDGPVALLLHGEPTWSYLYRRMIPPLVGAGYRCVAPDHIGFGRSDKVVDDAWYVADRHIERLRGFIERLDLRGITLFVQDWGGPIGLVNAVETPPERFSRLVVLNTWLHHEGFEYSPGIARWRASATDRLWLAWTDGDLPAGAIVQRSLAVPPADPQAIRRAYEAPFPERGRAKAGVRRFPWCLPVAESEAGAARRQAAAFEALKTWDRPAHFIFGEKDPIFTAAWGRAWAATVPGATFDTVLGGHFVQEDAGPRVVELFLRHAGAGGR